MERISWFKVVDAWTDSDNGFAPALLGPRTGLIRVQFKARSQGSGWTQVEADSELHLAEEAMDMGTETPSESERNVSGQSFAQIERIDRRRFVLRLGSSAASLTIVGAYVSTQLGCHRVADQESGILEPWSSANALPNADAAIHPVEGTRPEFTQVEDHYKVFNNPLPSMNIDEWRLNVSGLVERTSEWTLDEIKRPEPLHQFVTLSCISNPVAGPLISTTRWTGSRLQQLLPMWHLEPEATHLRIFGADDFHETVALATIQADDRVMLTYEWDGLPLPMEHGFPLRVYIPGRYGMKQPKWIVAIEATDHWEPGYAVMNGWDRDAIMQTTSVVDTVIVPEEGSSKRSVDATVLIGGIAHAGARGISKVEVQLNGGAWNEAQLRESLSDLTWAVWRYEWLFQDGHHTLAVRAHDGSGTLQEAEDSPQYPDGATGTHERDVIA